LKSDLEEEKNRKLDL